MKRSPLAVIAIASVLAVPAVAHASTPVNRHLAQGRAALADAHFAALAGRSRATADAVSRVLRSGHRAKRAVNRIHSRTRRAQGLRKVAAFDDDALGLFAGILDRVPVSTQDDLAQALDDSIDARRQVIDLLTELLPGLPEDVQSQIADAISNFESDGDIDALLQALASGDLTDQVSQLVSELIDELSEDLNDLTDQLATIEAQLPPDQAAALAAAIADLQMALAGAGDTLNQLLDEILLGGGDLESLCAIVTQLQVTLPIDICPAA